MFNWFKKKEPEPRFATISHEAPVEKKVFYYGQDKMWDEDYPTFLSMLDVMKNDVLNVRCEDRYTSSGCPEYNLIYGEMIWFGTPDKLDFYIMDYEYIIYPRSESDHKFITSHNKEMKEMVKIIQDHQDKVKKEKARAYIESLRKDNV